MSDALTTVRQRRNLHNLRPPEAEHREAQTRPLRQILRRVGVATDPNDKERKIPCEVAKPPREYRKASQCVSRLLKQRIRQRKSYRYQVAAAIVKHCLAHGIQLIAVEKLQIQNITKSNKGSVQNPGRNVAQKRSLNRRILEQGWAEVIDYIRYKAHLHHRK